MLKDNDDVSGRSMKENFEREVKTISTFDHENILRLIGVVVVGKRLYNFKLQKIVKKMQFLIIFKLRTQSSDRV